MSTNEKPLNRIWELDFLRGIALILMIYFHIIFDMENIYGFQVSTGGINYFIGKFSAILFILLAGISSTLSKNNSKRALKLLVLAMLITLVTHLYSSEFGIKFGILHFLGVCILISAVLKKPNAYLLFIFGSVLILLGTYTARISVSNDYFFILGLTSKSFSSSDYYPLIPWLGVFLYGLALGKIR